MEHGTFLGENPSYWAELKKRADTLNVSDLIRDLVNLQAKIAYYETQIERMNKVREMKDAHQ